ncbi:MAG: response regulator [Planctomycetes bacterium]|nr:response regulator [Planctomycetota bacterium]
MTNPNVIDLLREATIAVRANDKPRTRLLLLEATRLDPRNETAWQWLAGVAESPAEACRALESILALNPNNEKAKAALGPARLQAGIAAVKAKDPQTARRLLRSVIANEPRNETAWVWLASVAESPTEALAHLGRALEINPENAAAKRGVLHYRAKLAAAPPAEQAPKQALSDAPTVSAAKTDTKIVPRLENRRTPPQETVLIVDDSRTIRKLVAMTMTAAGFRVIEAEDGSTALDRIREIGVPTLILLDVAMPGMDGYELCRLVRRNPDTQKVPVIMLTGKDGFFDKIRGRLAGTNAYLSKPLQPDALLAAVRKHCPAVKV